MHVNMITDIKDNGQRYFIMGTKKQREKYEPALIWWNKLSEDEHKTFRTNNKPLELDEITNIYYGSGNK